MFSSQIVDSDAFLDMSPSAQNLYFHLGMSADDDGFVGNPKKILRMVGGTDDDLKILKAKRFILSFESGVVVIKHWLIHNLIRADRYKETLYKNEKNLLGLNKNGAYTELIDATSNLREGVAELTQVEIPEWLKIRRKEVCTANGAQTVLRLGKVRLGKVNTSAQTDLTDTPADKQEKDDQIRQTGWALFWSAYPRKIGKFICKKSFDKISPESYPKIMAALEIQKTTAQWQDPKYIPYPATWLNQQRWEDEVAGGTALTPMEIYAHECVKKWPLDGTFPDQAQFEFTKRTHVPRYTMDDLLKVQHIISL
jgi:hypothetical protein